MTVTARPRPTDRLAGLLMLAMTLLVVGDGLGLGIGLAPAGAAAWLAGLLLLGRLGRGHRLQAMTMVGIGAVCLGVGALGGAAPQFAKALHGNAALLAMLAGVSFLRLVALPRHGDDAPLPAGRAALWKSLLGIHLFGAVINFSAFSIMAERLHAAAPLGRAQVLLLSRGFLAASHWSPFFAAMAVALINAPGAELRVLVGVGVVAAAIVIAALGASFAMARDGANFVGYPMDFAALLVPGLLAAGVLLLHQLRPAIPVLALIALLSIATTLVVASARDGLLGLRRCVRHVGGGLPAQAGEQVLFLSAGVLAAGIATLIATWLPGLELPDFGPGSAWLLVVVLSLLSAAGIHPVITISVVGGAIGGTVPDPNLLGLAYLMTWTAGVMLGPFTVMQITLQARFGIGPLTMMRWNLPYFVALMGLDFIVLHAYAALS